MKKLFGMALLVLFMMSMSTVNTEVLNSSVEEGDCYDQVEIFYIQAENSGFFDQSELDWWLNGAYAVYCYGYTWDDVFNAP